MRMETSSRGGLLATGIIRWAAHWDEDDHIPQLAAPEYHAKPFGDNPVVLRG